ncbi:MAG: transglutaminaseTgpA domain-containing protein [Polyangiaceae bacterium]|nr:transglutaminaseTgpA domain-containing protein [Polyangiaceae bacterium]
MRFGLIHRVMTNALAALGIFAVVSTASLSPTMDAVLLVGLAFAIAIPERWQGLPALRHVATVAPLALLLLQAARLFAGRSPLDVAVEFSAWLQIVRLATRRGAAHDHQIIVLALLHFVAGTVLGGSLMYGLSFLGFLIVAPGALVLSHLRREVEGNYRQGARDRTGLPVDVPRILRSRRVVGRGFLGATCLLSVPILLFTTILFLLFPRIGLSLLLLSHPHAGRLVGFSEHVDLGDVGMLRDDPTIALRFELHEPPNPPPMRLTLRLRGTAFDAYDGYAWLRTLRDTPRFADRTSDPGDTIILYRGARASRDRVISFDLEPIDPPVVFLPPRAVAVRLRSPSAVLIGEPLMLVRGPEDELRYTGADVRGLRYDVSLAGDDETLLETLGASDRARYLALPPDMPSRIADLARRWTDGLASPDAQAFAIEQHLRRDFTYDLHSPSGGKPQPLDHFLFESQRGHCEFFSTAMAIMLRAVGIPSRNVTGFVGGTWNRFGHYYAVREGDAHSWVEAYIEDAGRGRWKTFDPTPLAGAQPVEPPGGVYYYLRDFVEALSQRWNTYVVGYDLHKQLRLFQDVAHRYDAFRSLAGADRGWLDRATRAPTLAVAVLAIATAYGARRRRRRRAGPPARRTGSSDADGAPGHAAVLLFRALEMALQAHGISRPASLPPLRHAEDLQTQKHPLGDEVLSLTQLYLQARFGGLELNDSARRDYERRVRSIRSLSGRRATRSALAPP